MFWSCQQVLDSLCSAHNRVSRAGKDFYDRDQSLTQHQAMSLSTTSTHPSNTPRNWDSATFPSWLSSPVICRKTATSRINNLLLKLVFKMRIPSGRCLSINCRGSRAGQLTLSASFKGAGPQRRVKLTVSGDPKVKISDQ